MQVLLPALCLITLWLSDQRQHASVHRVGWKSFCFRRRILTACPSHGDKEKPIRTLPTTTTTTSTTYYYYYLLLLLLLL